MSDTRDPKSSSLFASEILRQEQVPMAKVAPIEKCITRSRVVR